MKTQITKDLFVLTKDQEELSKNIYNGKIIKCLVAPYHSYAQLEEVVPFTKTTYLFPEREVPASKLIGLISMICKNPSNEEFRIITTNMNIITDMIDDCVRVLTESGDIVPSPSKTFAANIHTIRYDLLENKSHQLSESEKVKSRDVIQKIIDKINNTPNFKKEESLKILDELELIGEPIIETKLKEMLMDKTI